MSFSDKTLKCRECGGDFLFTVGEQEFYASKGLLNEPARCPDCRAARKAQRSAVAYSSDVGYTNRAAREMHPAVCADCGAQTQVPFLPRNDKPVYCSTCFDKVRMRR